MMCTLVDHKKVKQVWFQLISNGFLPLQKRIHVVFFYIFDDFTFVFLYHNGISTEEQK